MSVCFGYQEVWNVETLIFEITNNAIRTSSIFWIFGLVGVLNIKYNEKKRNPIVYMSGYMIFSKGMKSVILKKRRMLSIKIGEKNIRSFLFFEFL